MADLTVRDAQILGLYGGGKDIDTIVARTDLAHADVSHRLMQLCTMNRQRAQYLAREYADARRALLPPAPPAPAPTSAPVKPKKAGATPIDLSAVAAILADDASLTDKLEAAERSGVPRMVRIAKQIRDGLDELTEHARVADRERVLKSTIETLGDQLAKARDELKTLGRPSTPPRPANGGGGPGDPSAKELRTWAGTQENLPCPPVGRVPVYILEAWRRAHREGVVSL